MAKPTDLAGALEVIAEYETRLAKLEEQGGRTSKGIDSVSTSLDNLFALGSKAERMEGQVGNVSSAFQDMIDTVDGGIEGVNATMAGMGGALSTFFPGARVAAPFLGALGAVGKSVTMVGGVAIAVAESMVNLFDKPSEDMRMFDNQMFNVAKRFGGAHDEAKKFADSLKTETASEFARSMYMTRDEMAAFVSATDRTSLSLEQLGETVDTGIGVTTLYASVSAQATAMNIRAGAAAELLNTAMNKQGKSAQDAVEMLGSFSGIAEKTGLTAEKVAQTLNSAVSGFTKLGLAADFGRPILEGFSHVMDDMGLGIENATELTTSLTSALVGMTTSYENAYLMQQRGGVDLGGGGGGVLGASIGMQAAMLEAEKTGDQAAIGQQLVTGLRDTLTSFTGGDIVTVQQAAESPELQNQFYVQQQMLSKQFGISDPQQATRVLDLLADLDEATRTGDADAKAELEKQLSNEMDGRDKTLGEWDKANRQLEIQSNLLAVVARSGLEAARGIAAEGRERLITPGIEASGKAARDTMEEKLADWGITPDDPMYETLTSGTTGSGGGTGGTTATRAAALAVAGRGDNAGTLQAALSGNSGIGGLTANSTRMAMQSNINMAASNLAAGTSEEQIRAAGAANREEYEISLAKAIAAALSDSLHMTIDMTPAAGSNLEILSEANSNLSRGGNYSGTPPG
ncbi:hypothetical protein CMI47_03170 [Candidatus Pacearchaeota archaeon]|nr:hypothetical protein [Candidatus Pacearchaeota archaeon]